MAGSAGDPPQADDAVKRAHARSFGQAASTYALARPGYPAEAVRWLLADRDPDGLKVVDAGAGTGRLTEALRDLGCDVTAVEPLPEMLAELRRTLPGVAAYEGSGEALGLPDASADAVVYAQAWHWVDPALACPEAARVLAPGGHLGMIWNFRRTDDAFHEGLADLLGFEDAIRHTHPQSQQPDLAAPFGSAERATFAHAIPMTGAALEALVRSRSYVILLDEPSRARLLEEVGALHAAHAQDGLVEMRYETTVYRCRPEP